MLYLWNRTGAATRTAYGRNMIGSAKSGTADKQQSEIDKLVESINKRTSTLVPEGMGQAQSGQISAMERTVTTLKGLIKNPKLPKDVSLEIQRAIQSIESTGYKYYINDCLKKARVAALAHDDKLKHNMIKLAKDTLPKAVSAGAGADFKEMVTKVIEVIQRTGTPVIDPNKGTKAKPIDKNAPPAPPNRAKLGDPEPEAEAAAAPAKKL
jgi:hypothetical protein